MKEYFLYTPDDVKAFFSDLMERGIAVNPDDDYTDFINLETGKPSFSDEEGHYLNTLMVKAYEICMDHEVDIYEIANELFKLKNPDLYV